MRKYKKFNKKNKINGYIFLAIFVIGILCVSVGYSYFSDTLVITGQANAKYEIYDIEYILNNGENPENAVTSYKIIDDIPLPIPIRNQYTFIGWYDNEDFYGDKVLSTADLEGNVSLYARWKKVINYETEYNYDGEYVFNGDNYIDTGVYLYTKENINRNFLISFDIVEVDQSNINHSALMNSMNESGNPWYGHVVKVSVSGNNKTLKFESNSNTSSTGDVYISNSITNVSVTNVKVLRINNKLYYSFDDGTPIFINDYNGFKGYFEVPVTFGASMDGNCNPFRYFTGTLANMSVSFLDDDITIDDYIKKEKKERIVFAEAGPVTFDGQTDYIDTGLQLFNQENFEKDFEISFTIDSVEDGNVNQATIVNMKNERITSYPGFVYRMYQPHDGTIRFEAKAGSGSGASHKIVNVHSVKISRIESKMYLSINGGENKQVYDYTGFNKFFDVPLTIGASLDSKGNPFRFFKGQLSDIIIKVKE